MRNQNLNKDINREEASDVLKHLADSLQVQWRRYRKRLKRCQMRFSEEAVHDSRVESRRLLATVELLRAFIPELDLKKARRMLKDHLDTFDQLRDTQVQMVYAERLTRSYPQAEAFHKWLARRELRFTRETRRAVKHIKSKRLRRWITAFEKEIKLLHSRTSRARALAMALRAIQQAFDQVAQACRRVSANNTATIHRTRIAFKRFRYMVEALSPLLPAVTEEHRRAMRGYQSMMGDIQDVEVLLRALDKFLRTGQVDGRSARKLLLELHRRRQWLIRVYLNASGKLSQFWPLPGLVVPGAGRRRKGQLQRVQRVLRSRRAEPE
jgi:CHAD domain-containing protein